MDGKGTLEGLPPLQRMALEMLALEPDTRALLDSMCRTVEREVPDSVCSVTAMRRDRMRVRAAPNLPARAVEVIESLAPSELAGSCGTAAHTRTPVLVGDVAVDPRWDVLRDVARDLGVAACWSMPVFAAGGDLLGTFAITRFVPGLPDDDQRALLEFAGQLAGIALERERDESSLRRQKALLQSIVDGSGDPIFVKDLDGRYLIVNAAEADGIAASPDEMIGKTDEDLYPPEIAARARKRERVIIESGAGIQYEEEFENARHGRRVFLVRKSPRLDENGRVCGIIGIARDITEMRQASEALRRAQKLESLGVLAGGIAHDFNNLLTGILGNVGIALSRVEDGSLLWSNLNEAKVAAERGAELTRQLLAYAGRRERAPEVLALPAVVEEVLKLLGPSLSPCARIAVDVEPGLPNVEADPVQVRQLLMNLVRNASDALGGAEGRIDLGLSSDPERRRVLLRVRDTGMGMDDETRMRIFDPFFTTKRGGRGLGLAAAQGIARAHGGTLDVESAPGRGTTFTVDLPATTRSVVPRPAARQATWWRGDGCVLVVDDDEAVRGVAAQVLEDAGLDVMLAASGEAALELFEDRAAEIDLVLLDVTMQGLDGRETCRRLHALDPDLPILLSSGHDRRAVLKDLDPSEIQGFVPKPYLPRDLLAAVRKVLP